MMTLWIAIAIYAACGAATIWVMMEILTTKWWLWLIVGVLWPLYLFAFLVTRP
jgi:hypothetical protein